MNLEYLLVLVQGPMNLDWRQVVMIVIGGVLIYLAITKEYEPLLLLPIGFGVIATNLPLTGIFDEHGLLGILYRVGIRTEIFPRIPKWRSWARLAILAFSSP
jgi:oxaloacetate decarboxylase beta subunit